jgi:signal transduction histidine kinase
MSGVDALAAIQLALAAIFVGMIILVAALYAERSRSRRLMQTLATEIDRLAEGSDSNAAMLPRNDRLSTLVASIERLLSATTERDAQALESTSTNKLMARELKRLTRLLDASSEGMIALDNAQKVLFANQAAAPHFSVPPEDAAGKRIQECLRDGRVIEMLSAEVDEGATESVRTVELPPNSEFGHGHLAATIAACNDEVGDPIGHLMMFRDVDEVKTLRRQQIQFVEQLAEEFRVPLTSVRAHAETMTASTLGESGVVTDGCAAIRDEGRRLAFLLDNLVIISRIECGVTRVESEAMPLKVLLEAIVEAIKPECEKKNVTLTCNLPDRLPTLYADENLLRIVLMNIVANAVQYTADSGTITIETASHEEDIQVSIRDTGCGIEEDHLESIFQKFYRCPASDSVPGSGIGLSVARQIVRMHGGDIDVSSHVGHGSQFTVVLPRTLLQASAMDVPAA